MAKIKQKSMFNVDEKGNWTSTKKHDHAGDEECFYGTCGSKPKIKEENYALDQAKAQLESIKDIVALLNNGEHEESARQTINEDALEVAIRSGWYSPGDSVGQPPEEYLILLCTGGPAVRIIGNLDEYYQPETATIEYQDWGTPWIKYNISKADEDIVLQYASCFYFGE